MLLALACCLVATTQATSRPFTVDDLLHTEGFASVRFDPTGRWLVFERLLPLTTIQRFDTISANRILRARLYGVDLQHPGIAQPLLDEPSPGTVVYGFSPDGQHLAIGRLDGDTWRLGIIFMPTHTVRWFDINPDASFFGQTLAWLSNDELVAITNPRGRLPAPLALERLPPTILPARWKATETSEAASVTVLGSGRFLNANPPPPSKSLVILNVRSGARETIASGPFLTLTPSPDHRYVALVEQGRTEALPQHRPLSQIDWPYKRRLAVAAVADRHLWHPCPDCDLADALQWSPASDRLAFIARRDGEDWPTAGLMTVNVDEQRITSHVLPGLALAVAKSKNGTAKPAIAWRDDQVMIFARRHNDRRFDWYVVAENQVRDITASLPATASRLTTTRTCQLAMPTAGAAWCLDGDAPRRIGRADTATAFVDGSLVQWRRTSAGVGLLGDVLAGRHVVLSENEALTKIAASPNARALVIGLTARDGEKQLLFVSRSGQTRIAVANSYLRAVRPATAQPIRTSLADGRTITSWLYLPSNRTSAAKMPLIIIPYPGQVFGDKPPADQSLGSDRLFANAQLAVAAGYAVLLPSLPEPETPATGMLRFADQLDPIVDAAVATGTIDPARLALWGASYGGYAVALIASETCRYRSIIAEHGIYDLGTLPATFGPISRLATDSGLPVAPKFAWAETGQGRMGTLPWTDPSRYVSNSPYYRAGRITTPLMIITADRDSAPLGQAEEMFSALFRQNKDAELVTYWGEGHVVASPANLRDLYARVFGWLGATLKDPNPGRHPCRAMPPTGRTSAAANAPGPMRSEDLRSNRSASDNRASASARAGHGRASLRGPARHRGNKIAETARSVPASDRRSG
jgi:dipeptidyl aminopeptidase/acylaminoacyl peptidase